MLPNSLCVLMPSEFGAVAADPTFINLLAVETPAPGRRGTLPGIFKREPGVFPGSR